MLPSRLVGAMLTSLCHRILCIFAGLSHDSKIADDIEQHLPSVTNL